MRSPLEERATRLIRRGFDVPPSKEAEYQSLRENGYKADEIKEIMGLE